MDRAVPITARLWRINVVSANGSRGASAPVVVSLGGEVAAKEAGKARDEGKEYIVKDGDVMLFKFNA